jgi:hypothetical protein
VGWGAGVGVKDHITRERENTICKRSLNHIYQGTVLFDWLTITC